MTAPGCRGLFYRVVDGAYVNPRGTVRFWREYRLLKRKSCTGCPECAPMLESIAGALRAGTNGDMVQLMRRAGAVPCFRVVKP